MGGKVTKIQDEEQLNKMADMVAEKEKAKYGEIDRFFKEFDYNGDNTLGQKEFVYAIKAYIKLHPDKEENLNDLILHFDSNSESVITLEEFRRIMIVYLSNDISIEHMIDVFKCFDKNLNGMIGANEIKHVFSKLGLNLTPEEAKTLVEEGDVDGDQTLDFEEFLKIMIAK